MSVLVTLCLAVGLALAPIFSGLPDEPLWSSWLCVIILLASAGWIIGKPAETPPAKAPAPASRSAKPFAVKAFAFLLIWATLSAVVKLIEQHSTAFLGPMLRGWAVLAAEFALFWLTWQAAQTNRTHGYALTLAVLGGGAAVAAWGTNEYLTHLRLHEPGWRVFSTSTPDFLAGYLAMLVPLSLAWFPYLPGARGVSSLLRGLLTGLLGLVVLVEVIALLTTQSRFAIVSVTAGLAAWGGALAYAVRRGLVLSRMTRALLAGMTIAGVLAGGLVARPVLHRLRATGTGDNSAAFRLWTWRGAAHMAAAHPIAGAGIGIWADTYLAYAITGFTRLAHNSYLQMADECGLPGLAALLATLGAVSMAAAHGLRHPLVPPVPAPNPAAPKRIQTRRKGKRPASPPAPINALPEAMPPDDRLLLCGLLGSLAAGVVQNLIDSDWYVFFLGLTFWGLAGLAAGIALRGQDTDAVPALTPRPRLLTACAAVLLAALFAAQGISASFSAQAHAAETPQEAATNYELAALWNPLSATPLADNAIRVQEAQGNLPAAETLLRQAVTREPSAVNERRLGTVLAAQGKAGEAHAAFERGLRADPQSLDILLALAQGTPPPNNLSYYQTIARLEQSPVGTVRAIGGVTETKFAIADAALGDAAAHHPSEARDYYARAARLLEAYADEGGSANPQRQAMQGGHPNPAQDAQLRTLYAHVMAQWKQVAAPSERAMLEARQQTYTLRFASL